MKKKPAPTIRIVLAFLFDLCLSGCTIGYLMAWWKGEIVNGNFNLSGTPALVCFSSMFLYFYVMRNYFNGSFGKRIFRVRNVFMEVPINEYLDKPTSE